MSRRELCLDLHELRKKAALRARLFERESHERPEVPLVGHVDGALRAAMDRPQHLLRIEVAGFGGRHGGHLDAVMEVQDHELDEEEAVLAPVATLEAALLDLAERRGVVLGEHVGDVVIGDRVGDAAGFARETEPDLGQVLPVLAAERPLGQQAEALVVPELRLVDRGAEKKRAEEPQYTAEPFGLVGLLGERLERAPAREQLHFEELPFSSADRMSSTGSCVRKRRASSFTKATEPGLTGELSSAAIADSWTRRLH